MKNDIKPEFKILNPGKDHYSGKTRTLRENGILKVQNFEPCHAITT